MAREWRNDGRNRSNQGFATVDGEGGNIPDRHALFGTEHAYLLLRADEFELETGNPLTYSQCFDFLAALPRNRIWTGFFFDYDVTMMCKGLTEERARRLFDPTLRMVPNKEFPYQYVEVDNKYEIGYRPRQEFRVREKGMRDFTIISDTGTFFQTSFVRTLDKWNVGTEEERAMIAEGKAMRGDFAEVIPKTRDYNALECILHNQLMEQFRQVCKDVGYVPQRWQGPGNLAAAMLKAHGIPKRDDIPIMGNWKFRELANAAYYGGRAETTAVGHVPGPIYQWDINGAYVDALRYLPCLIHGSWKFVRTRPALGKLWVGRVEFGHDSGRLLYNLPVRKKDGNVFFPRFGDGHYWSCELEAAEKAGTRLKFVEGWVYERHCKCEPFDWIPGYYLERLRLGKSGKGTVLKLGGNSIYGKLCQSIGAAPWANPVWAGLCTAMCRAKIVDAYRDDPDDVLMIMTDGIFTRRTPGLSVSAALGDWELTVHDYLFVVQPGIYFLPNSIKTRGVPMGRIYDLQDEFRERFEQFSATMRMPEPVSVPVDNFITMRQALAWNRWDKAGTWDKTTRNVSYDWTNKRQGAGLLRERDSGTLRTIPIDSDIATISVPYDRIIGGNLNLSPFDPRRRSDGSVISMRDDEAEQPDWNEPLIAGTESLPDRYTKRLTKRLKRGKVDTGGKE